MKRSCFVFLLVSVLFAGATANAQIGGKRASIKAQPNRLAKRPEARTPVTVPAAVGTVNIRVVWNEIYGLPPAYAGSSEAYPSPCGLFQVSVYNVREKVRSSERGAFEIERANGVERYVCSYTIEALPKGEQLAVIAAFPDSRDLETIPWISVRNNAGAMPGIGQQRVLNGARTITLTDEVAVANIAFRVQYETPKVSEIY